MADLADPKALRQAASALRAEADAQRRLLHDRYERLRAENGIARDRAAREEYAAHQATKSADIQVERERRAAKDFLGNAANSEAAAAAAEKAGNAVGAEEAREQAEMFRRAAASADARAEQAVRDAADLGVRAAEHHREVVLADQRRMEVAEESNAVETQLDLIETRARNFEDASRMLDEAQLLEDPPLDADIDQVVMKKASLEVDAEQLIQQARSTQIDAAGIVTITGRELRLPDLTSQIQPAPPSPQGTEAEGAAVPPADDAAQSSVGPEVDEPAADELAVTTSDLGADRSESVPDPDVILGDVQSTSTASDSIGSTDDDLSAAAAGAPVEAGDVEPLPEPVSETLPDETSVADLTADELAGPDPVPDEAVDAFGDALSEAPETGSFDSPEALVVADPADGADDPGIV